jgi:D-beta-D-heptose 7-phosphate kinase/D-beta-D-heptose 1-phosphate adenosyltransferase
MPQQKQFKVLLIGDSCIDEYVYGVCTRLNPEAPVPVLQYTRTEKKPGMAMNVLENLKSFNIDVDFITNKENIVKTRYIDEKYNHQILRVDYEGKLKQIDHEIFTDEYDALVISDYNKGFISNEKLFGIIENSKCPVFVDSKKRDLNIPFKKDCYVKINDIEYKNLTKEVHNLIITMGGKGAEYDGKMYPAEKVNVFDVVGAGDTFLSSLVYFYLFYGRIESAIPYANKAAAIAVSHPGTYILKEEDVKSLCN